MALPDIAEQVVQDVTEARHALVRCSDLRGVANIERALVSMVCHISAVGMAHYLGTGIFTGRVKRRSLSSIEAEQVHQLAAALKANTLLLNEAVRYRRVEPGQRQDEASRIKNRKLVGILAEINELVERIDGMWGRFRGKATVYIPYRVDKVWADGFQASAEFNWPGGGYTISGGIPGLNAPKTPEEAEKALREGLSRDISRYGVPFEARPFKPKEGRAMTFEVTAE